MYGITELMCEAVNDEDSISVTSNINSPGKIVITLKNVYDIIKSNAKILLVIYFLVFGGAGFGLEFEGAASRVLDLVTADLTTLYGKID